MSFPSYEGVLFSFLGWWSGCFTLGEVCANVLRQGNLIAMLHSAILSGRIITIKASAVQQLISRQLNSSRTRLRKSYPMLKMNTCTGQDLDPTLYLEMSFKHQSVYSAIKEFALVNVHKFFTTNYLTSRREPLKVLDYGCGPVLAYDISAARVGGEVVLAEYADKCRDAIQQWLNREPSAWDWSQCIKYVVQDLEGGDKKEAIKREENLREAIKAVVPCDITQDPPIAKGFEGPYDVVMSMLCIENGCLTRDEYKTAVRRISTLVKRGGSLLLYSSNRNREEHDQTPGYYYVGETRHVQVALPLQFVLTTLKENGFNVVETNMLPDKENEAIHNCEETDLETTAFITATKV